MKFITMSIRRFIELNKIASRAVNHLLPQRVVRDGNSYFLTEIAPKAIQYGQNVWDVGGAQPFIAPEKKQDLALTVTGLDVDKGELLAAPKGAYDEIVVADLCTYVGTGSADVVICQATLEHVPDATGAVRVISQMLKPGGKALIFAPSRNAVFARLNLLLPQKWKENMLYFVSPEVEKHQGFPAFYDKCTPYEIEKLFTQNGLTVVEKHLFWMSSYFMTFLPAFIIWRLWQAVFVVIAGDNAAETFAYVVMKDPV